MNEPIWIFFKILIGMMMGALGGIILFNFSYLPYNLYTGMVVGGIISIIYLTLNG